MDKPETKITHVDERKGDIRESYAEISRAKKELGFKCDYSISEGLKKMVEMLD
jgi:nucleoside-diphosphate-sugar epimerase